MKKLTISLFAIALAATPISAMAKKVYSGQEAEAIRCAQLHLFLANAGQQVGVLNKNEARKLTVYAAYVLKKYTSGSDKQRVQAIKQMSRDTSFAQSLDKLKRSGKVCQRKFR